MTLRADGASMVAHAQPFPATRIARVRWSRLPLVVMFAAALTGVDTVSKASAVVAGNGSFDTPTSLVRPAGTLLVGLMALSAVLLLPRLCVPGALLVMGGVSSNIVSLALWHAVPNPFEVAVAGGMLHFNLADVCIGSGSLLVLVTVLWTIWRMPTAQFERLVGSDRQTGHGR